LRRARGDQAQAEEWEASTSLKRSQDLLAKGFVSQSAVDTAKARADRAVAGVANAKARSAWPRPTRATRKSPSITR
jgi:multidrug resistance efflux pump